MNVTDATGVQRKPQDYRAAQAARKPRVVKMQAVTHTESEVAARLKNGVKGAAEAVAGVLTSPAACSRIEQSYLFNPADYDAHSNPDQEVVQPTDTQEVQPDVKPDIVPETIEEALEGVSDPHPEVPDTIDETPDVPDQPEVSDADALPDCLGECNPDVPDTNDVEPVDTAEVKDDISSPDTVEVDEGPDSLPDQCSGVCDSVEPDVPEELPLSDQVGEVCEPKTIYSSDSQFIGWKLENTRVLNGTISLADDPAILSAHCYTPATGYFPEQAGYAASGTGWTEKTVTNGILHLSSLNNSDVAKYSYSEPQSIDPAQWMLRVTMQLMYSNEGGPFKFLIRDGQHVVDFRMDQTTDKKGKVYDYDNDGLLYDLLDLSDNFRTFQVQNKNGNISVSKDYQLPQITYAAKSSLLAKDFFFFDEYGGADYVVDAYFKEICFIPNKAHAFFNSGSASRIVDTGTEDFAFLNTSLTWNSILPSGTTVNFCTSNNINNVTEQLEQPTCTTMSNNAGSTPGNISGRYFQINVGISVDSVQSPSVDSFRLESTCP